MSFDNPSFYISIFSSVCLFASEILPFVPIKSNGIIHLILTCLSSQNKKQVVVKDDIADIKNKLSTIIVKIDKINNIELHEPPFKKQRII